MLPAGNGEGGKLKEKKCDRCGISMRYTIVPGYPFQVCYLCDICGETEYVEIWPFVG